MSDNEIDGVVQRLVEQFASPYDFLREVVQNSMDAGSDMVDVRLYAHPGDDGASSVFELEIADAGRGMDEEIIDTQLTRLFSSSKAGDRTMAGGFGIGFVSVFAWRPERLLVQTGRREEAWEVEFFADRRFEKVALDEPLEGTVVRLFRRGHVDERDAIAHQVWDALWRWCRYCGIEITFEDVDIDEEPRAVEANAWPEDAVAQLESTQGETTLRLAFCSTPAVTLLRHGLVLAEGTIAELFPSLAARLGRTTEHLWIWVDSPRLQTSLAREGVVDDEGKAFIESSLTNLLPQLRQRLLEAVEARAGRASTPGEDDPIFSHLHQHLLREHQALGVDLQRRALLRAATDNAISVAGLITRARLGVVGVVAPGDADADALDLRVAALKAGVPLLLADWPRDRAWVHAMAEQASCSVGPVRSLCSRIEVVSADGDALCSLVRSVFSATDAVPKRLGYARFVDADQPWLCGVGESAAVSTQSLAWSSVAGESLWLNVEHPLLRHAIEAYTSLPSVADLCLAQAVAATFRGGAPQAEEITKAWAHR